MSDETPEAGKPAESPEKPFSPEGSASATPAGNAPNPYTPPETAKTPSTVGPGAPYGTPRPKRSSAQIRADIDAQRAELGQSVDQLRDRVTELTDWKGQLRKHRKQIIIGAVATGFIVGGLAALRRR
jgi:hypothetical protein